MPAAPNPKKKSVMPTSIKIGTQVFNVIERSADVDGMLTDNTYGYTLDEKNLIVVDADIHKTKKQITLLHEILHACRMVFDNSLKPKKTDDFDTWEHYFIGTIENSLLLVFSQNPGLIDWLLEDSEL
jgi:Zn-dependent peptidase ImmA (M78 family)